MVGSLVAYKGKYAQITAEIDSKFELVIGSGKEQKTQKVRLKDFRFLAPNFAIPSDNLSPDLTILTDLAEEVLSIAELSEWIFGKYSANSAWHTYLLVEDGLYFYWQKDLIFIRPTNQVKSIQEKRAIEAQEKLQIANFLQSSIKNTYTKEDLPLIQEIEKVALGINKSAKILKILKINNTPQDAHKFLVKINYWDLFFNPYPTRYKILPAEDNFEVVETTQGRKNLTHIQSYAIDNLGSVDADDAIALELQEYGYKIWVHIADVASFANDEILTYASHRVSNLYSPEATILMLPEKMTELCSLGFGENTKDSKALSIGFVLKDDGKIEDIEVVKSIIKVKNTDYDSVDRALEVQEVEFLKFNKIALKHQQYRKNQGSFNLDLPKVDVKITGKDNQEILLVEQTNTLSRNMVAEFMILAGRAVAQFAEDNAISMPFVTQEKGDFSEEILTKEKLTLSESFASIRLFKRSVVSTTPSLHFGMGLDKYIRITSPLRRYLDLVAHQQLHNFINGLELFTEDEIKEKIMLNNAGMGDINKAARDSNKHYKLLFLLNNKQKFTAVVLRKNKDKATVMLPQLGMIETLKVVDKNIDDEFLVKFENIDIFNQEVIIKAID